MTETSARFALPLLQAGQAQKELFHNEAIMRLDAIAHPAVAEIATNAPPAMPAVGRSWIVGTAPSGAWIGHAGAIATWSEAGWRFVTPVHGMTAWLEDRGFWAWYDDAVWQNGPLPCAGVAVGGVRVVGARQSAIAAPTAGATVDTEARAALASVLSALRSHGLIAT